jgi:hypothetical protein
MCVGGSTYDVTYSDVCYLSWGWEVEYLAGVRVSLDVRGRFTAEPLSALLDLEADVSDDRYRVDGLDEAFELPCVEGDLGLS